MPALAHIAEEAHEAVAHAIVTAEESAIARAIGRMFLAHAELFLGAFAHQLARELIARPANSSTLELASAVESAATAAVDQLAQDVAHGQ